MIPFPRTRLVPRFLVIIVALTILWSVLYGSLLWTTTATHIERSSEQQAQHTIIISYLTGPIGAKDPLEFLTVDERTHMQDVKRLFDVAFIIHLLLLGAAIGCVGTLAYQKLWSSIDDLLARSMWWAGWSIICIMGLTAIAAALNFTAFWTLFHVFLFPQGNWMFPYDSVLITLYPAMYFQSAVLSISLKAGIAAIILIFLGSFQSKARIAQEAFTERATDRDVSGTSESSRANPPQGNTAAPSRAHHGSATSRRRSAGRDRVGRGRA
jgi:integral membrane protein (TIGR01906 family)